jgi:hypothetical protein
MHLGMSYTELQRLPVRYRSWYVNRLSKHFKDKNEVTQNKSSSGFDSEAFSKFEKTVNKKL